jgi:hypothetical protein
MRTRRVLLASPLLLSGLTFGCNNVTNDLAGPGDVTEAAAVTAISADECPGSENDQPGKRFEKRCHHYKHSERSRAYQAGAAKMTTRALIDVNKVTTIEATTGTFDDGSTPPGWFDKVRVRTARLKRYYTLDDDGDDRDFGDFKTKSGYFSVAYPTPPMPDGKPRPADMRTVLLHSQKVRITGVIKGVDPRTAVITVDDQVKYRPDLSIVRIDAPNATVGMPASVTAMVQERMGDLGALADCVLSVDGVVSDRAQNVWVDNSGTVSCQFAHTFTTAGVHALHVDVANVRPADYDMRNNGADASITVGSSFSFSGSAIDGSYTSSYREQVLDTASNVLFEQTSTSSGHNHSVTLSGMWPQTASFPLSTMSVNASSAGATWSIFAASAFAGAAQDDGSTCASGPDASGFNWVTLCSSSSAGPVTQITVSEFAGDVTYHSDMTCRQTSSFYDCTDGYSWNSDGSNSAGVGHPLDGAINLQIAVTDAGGTALSASAAIPVQPYTVAQDQALACTTGPDGARDCTEQHYAESGMSGSAAQ